MPHHECRNVALIPRGLRAVRVAVSIVCRVRGGVCEKCDVLKLKLKQLFCVGIVHWSGHERVMLV